MYLRPDDWLAIVEREYLRDFVAAGGAAVKLAVAPEPVADRTRAGLERLASLGGSWSPTDKPHVIVPALGEMEAAPELPKLETYRDRATFLAGAAWLFAFIINRAKQ